ncbi:MAG: hypothetical protein ACXU82_17625 [Caulobacteraceae bacterium]
MSMMPSPSAFAGARLAGAVVSKVDPIAHADRYLRLTETGACEWVLDPDAATPFASMREAARMAVRLPAGQRAFGVPIQHH